MQLGFSWCKIVELFASVVVSARLYPQNSQSKKPFFFYSGFVSVVVAGVSVVVVGVSVVVAGVSVVVAGVSVVVAGVSVVAGVVVVVSAGVASSTA